VISSFAWQLEIFGSFRTWLYLPRSYIDVSIFISSSLGFFLGISLAFVYLGFWSIVLTLLEKIILLYTTTEKS
jgi:hypothetical protein